ncbi:MAG: hypothetical protein ABL952_12735 [Pyrinomonadaceae bacterium]
MKILVVLLFFCLNVITNVGQSEPALTNDDIVKLSQAGIPSVVIQSKIKTSKVKFDTTTAAILALGIAKVADIVVAMMVERQAEMDAPKKQVVYGSTNPEYGTLSEISGKNKIFVAVQDSKSRTIILNALNESKRFQLVGTREEADFGVNFELRNVDAGSNVFLGTAHNVVVVGRLQVYTYLPIQNEDSSGRIRILYTSQKTQDWSGGMTFNRHPAQNAVNDFVKDFKKLK